MPPGTGRQGLAAGVLVTVQGTASIQSGAVRSAAAKSRLYSLQALRGVAAGLVVIAHAIEHPPGEVPNAIILTGRFGVDIFFVISGFVIAHVAGAGTFSPSRFMFRRIWRVVPLYWMLTFLVAALAIVAPAIFLTTQFDLGYLVKSLLFIPDPLPGTDDWRPLFKLGWTLNYEMFFYVAMAALFWCRTMLARAIWLTVIMGALIVAALVMGPKPTLLGFYANLNLMPFLFGVWLAWLWQEGRVQALPSYATPLALVAALALTAWFYQFPYDLVKQPLGHFAMSAAALAIAVSALLLEERAKNFRASVWLGDISYSLYLVHMFVVGAGWAVLNRLGVELMSPMGCAGVIGIVVASLAAAHISYVLFERPLNQMVSRRQRLKTAPAPSA